MRIGNIVTYHFTIKSTKDCGEQATPIFKNVPAPITMDTCFLGIAYSAGGVCKTSFRLYDDTLYLNEILSTNIPYIVAGSYIAK